MKHLKKHILVILCALQVQYSLALNLQKDWLIDGSSYQAKVTTTDKELCLSNGLLSRTFILSPNVATIAFDNLMNGNAELRAIRPEAVLTINGMEYPVGGLYKQPVQNFLNNDFIEDMISCDTAFTYVSHTVGETIERFPYRPKQEWLSNKNPWPAPGKRIVFIYKAAPRAPEMIRNVTVKVIYELYDGAPILSKQIEVENQGKSSIVLNSFKSEILALTETAPKVHYGEPHEIRMLAQEPGTYTRNYRKSPAQTDAPREYIDRFTQLFVVTDYAMGGITDSTNRRV